MEYFTSLGGAKPVTQLCTFFNYSNQVIRVSASVDFVHSFIHGQPVRCRRKENFKTIYISRLKCDRHLNGAGTV
jgi:hypothetical protein